jgi:hypothetical protein
MYVSKAIINMRKLCLIVFVVLWVSHILLALQEAEMISDELCKIGFETIARHKEMHEEVLKMDPEAGQLQLMRQLLIQEEMLKKKCREDSTVQPAT